MTPERWRQLTAVFHGARAHETDAQRAFLDAACGGDASLRAEVEALLAAEAEARRAGNGPLSAGGLPSLPAGTQLGHYRVEALVGAGGMGQVYRATDMQLHRSVALKILTPGLADALDFGARLEREAHLLASLNHPNIAAIYGMADAGGIRSLVLEFVEGPTLGERLARGPLPVKEALAVARQIASALEAAHARGIVHRDLKPANIKITPAGEVKVLDFGIGKIADAGPADVTARTATGLILGTPAYMSPEQARGLTVDKRTDIWAFGCVLFEMLAGRRPFDARTASDTVARILEREPEWQTLPGGVPDSIRTLLRRCLQKDPADRLHDIADARLEIADALTTAPSRAHAAAVTSRERRLWIALAAISIVTIASLWWSFGRRVDRTAPSSIVEFGVRFPDNHFPAVGLAVSPDGHWVAAGVFSSGSEIWLHSLDTSELRPLHGSDGGAEPIWSPDSSTVAFFQGRQLRAIEIASGHSTTVCDLPANSLGGTWGGNGFILFAADRKIFKVAASGGVAEPLPLKEDLAPTFPVFLPDQRHFIYFAPKRGSGSVRLASVDAADSTWLVDSDAPAVFVPPDRLLFVRGAALMAQTLNPQRLTLEGAPAIVTSGVSLGLLFGPQAKIAASATVLAFDRPRGGSAGQLTWFERSGTSVGVLPQPRDGEYLNPAISPDGKQVAVNYMDPQTGNWDIWVIDVARGVPSRMTADMAMDTDPVWSPDGKEIAFASERGGRLGLYRQAVSGSTPAELVIALDDQQAVVPTSWSADGKYLLYVQIRTVIRSAWALPLTGDRRPVHLVDDEFAPYALRVSPDGKWLAYVNFKTGTGELYVRPFLAPGEERQISRGGGVHPRWTKDGHELVYWAVPGGVNAVDFQSDGSTFRVGPPRALVQAPVLSLIDARTHFDITPDGQRLLVRQPAGPQGAGVEVMLNWTEKLKRQ